MGGCFLGVWLAFLLGSPAGASFAVNGTVEPAGPAVVWLFGATDSFSISTLSDAGGRFHFAGILPGVYTLTVITSGLGEWRETIDIGAAVADAKGRVDIQVHLDGAKALDSRREIVSARELSIPDSARKEYDKAEQRLSKHDVDGAVAHFQRATELAPQFVASWNSLGTIAYHERHYAQAELYFRKALAAGPNEYEPLVNLAGVLINLGHFRDAWSYNKLAVSKQPNDALAHAQLGMACFALGQLDAAESELREAIRLDPRHFSNPQLLLADIYEREHEPSAAADILEQFLKLHPGFPQAAQILDRIARLRASNP